MNKQQIPSPEEYFEQKYQETKAMWSADPLNPKWKKFGKQCLSEYAKEVVKYTLEQVEVLLENEKYGAGSINRDEYKMRVESSLQSLPEKINKELNL